MNAKQKLYDDFLHSCTEKLNIAQRFRQDPARYMTLKQNHALFSGMAEYYDQSYANAEYLHALGFDDADLLSVIYRTFDRSLRNVCLYRPVFIWNKNELAVALKEYFASGNRQALQQSFDRLASATIVESEDAAMLETATTVSPFAPILESAQADTLDWMAEYGVYISPLEQEMCRFWFALSPNRLNKLAKHIVDAFFHGFVSQSRSIQNRTNVRLVYAIGQEALAQRVCALMQKRGMQVIVLQPSSLAYSPQCLADHAFDDAAYMAEDYYESQMRAYSLALRKYKVSIQNTCGFIRIGTFGAPVTSILPGSHSYLPNAEMLQMHTSAQAHCRRAEAELLKPDHLSFCSVVFPDMAVGANFPQVFDAFYKINTQPSAPYERIQQALIDILDECSQVHIVGASGNRTNLTVTLPHLPNGQTQTNFLNCGGDINIPHGELFTTPQLQGTNGILHVSALYLKQYFYQDLWLSFQNGLVDDWGCDNFPTPEEGHQYVFQTLLHSRHGVTMGEFSIGSNTLAYRTASQLNLFSRLPILLAEKMGPHIAVGDPCFAGGEDSSVYNLIDGKEMVARCNEHTQNRHQNPDCYFHFHTDITLPFREVGLLAGVHRETGQNLTILRDGLFVPPAAHKLNENLE